MRSGLFTVLGILGLGALLYYGAQQEAQVECDLCLRFKGFEECRTGVGADRDAAMMSAVTNACALIANGVTQTMQCHATPASSVVCRGE